MTFDVRYRLRAFRQRSDSLDLDRSRSRAPSNCIQMIIYMMRVTDLLFPHLRKCIGEAELVCLPSLNPALLHA